MTAFVVDANVMNYFQAERLTEPAIAHEALEHVLAHGHIALDDGGHCRQEWLDCAAGAYPLALDDWINDRLVDQKIQMYRMMKDSMHKQLMCLGIPKKDHKWVRISISSDANALITEDIDLIDPTKKRCDERTIDKIKSRCSGPVAKILRKRFAVNVMCCRHVKQHCNDNFVKEP